MRMRGGWPDQVGRGRRSGEDVCARAAGGCVRWSGEGGGPAGLCGYPLPPAPPRGDWFPRFSLYSSWSLRCSPAVPITAS